MSNTNVNGNSHHEDIVTESTSGLSNENHLNSTTDAEASNSVSTNSNGTTIDSQNSENRVTKRAPDWSFLEGVVKKRKHDFKVRLVSKLMFCHHGAPNGYSVQSWVLGTNQ